MSEERYSLAVMKSGFAGLETNSLENSGKSMKSIALPNKYKVIICQDRYHACYGKRVEIFEGLWKGREIHVERFNDDIFSVVIDKIYGKLYVSYSEMAAYVESHL